MPSFDVVSRTDLNEVDNAINGVRREIKQRFDLAGTKCAIDRTDDSLTMTADDSMKMRQLEELLRKYLANRKVDQRALDFQPPQNAAGGSLRQSITIKQGIDGDLGRKINKAVRGASRQPIVTELPVNHGESCHRQHGGFEDEESRWMSTYTADARTTVEMWEARRNLPSLRR